MAAEQAQSHGSITRIVIIGLLVFIADRLVAYAPLVPKLIAFMDNVQQLREAAPRYEKLVTDGKATAESINAKLANLESKLSVFCKQDAERRGEKWQSSP